MVPGGRAACCTDVAMFPFTFFVLLLGFSFPNLICLSQGLHPCSSCIPLYDAHVQDETQSTLSSLQH